MENFICNICGYPELKRPPRDKTGTSTFDICPCCGGEFGYNDATPSAEDTYRKNWIQHGAGWFEPGLKPDKWNLSDQLLNIGIVVRLTKE